MLSDAEGVIMRSDFEVVLELDRECCFVSRESPNGVFVVALIIVHIQSATYEMEVCLNNESLCSQQTHSSPFNRISCKKRNINKMQYKNESKNKNKSKNRNKNRNNYNSR